MTIQRMRQAFTLIELLVVISVIGVLAAIIFPAYTSARHRAKSTACLSNLRQVGKAIAMYASDADDHLPFAADPVDKQAVLNGVFDGYTVPQVEAALKIVPNIQTVLRPFGASADVFRCPEDRILADDPQIHTKSTWFEEFGSSYSYQYTDEIALTGGTLSVYGTPSADILMWEYQYWHTPIDYNTRFSARFNALYADFHVKSVTELQRENGINLPPN